MFKISFGGFVVGRGGVFDVFGLRTGFPPGFGVLLEKSSNLCK